jgi:hypothetical protein
LPPPSKPGSSVPLSRSPRISALAWIRRRFFGTGFLRSFIFITLGGAIIATISAALGAVG